MEMGKVAMIAVIAIMVVAIGATVYVNVIERGDTPVNPDYATIGICAEHGYEPFFIASEAGHFGDHAIIVNLVVKESESEIMDSLDKGEIDIGAFGTSQFLHMIDEYGDKYKLVGRYSLDSTPFGATVTDGKYADFKFDGKTSLIGAGIGVDLKSQNASAVLRYLEATGEIDKYEIQGSIGLYNPDKVNIYDVDDKNIGIMLSEKENHVDIVVGGSAVVDTVESNTSAFKYVECDYGHEFQIPISIYASSKVYMDRSVSVMEILYALYDACSDIAADEGSKEKNRAIDICKTKLQVSDNVINKYLIISAWSVGYTAGIDKVSIESVFKYSVTIDKSQYHGNLYGKTEINIDPYVYLGCLPE